MDLIEKNALFIKDEEGAIIITDIEEKSPIIRGEIVYDGKNTVVLNRDNKKYYALKNIPPFVRDELKESKEVTVIEKKGEKDIYSYRVNIRMVDDLGMADDWNEYSEKVLKAIKNNLKEEDFDKFMAEAEKIYKEIS